MSKFWSKEHPRPKQNTIEFELERLERIHDALMHATLAEEKKHIFNDLQELRYTIDNLKELIEEGGK